MRPVVPEPLREKPVTPFVPRHATLPPAARMQAIGGMLQKGGGVVFSLVHRIYAIVLVEDVRIVVVRCRGGRRL
jgi:hypothetical protein